MNVKLQIQNLANRFGYEIVRRPEEVNPFVDFRTERYLRYNSRRLEHLASLSIPVANCIVLELGAGIGDLTSYYLDRHCIVTTSDVREELLHILKTRHNLCKVLQLDLDSPTISDGLSFQIVHCYGVLYHLRNPGRALEFINRICSQLLLIETCVSFGQDSSINLLDEDSSYPSQAVYGVGCRPTRRWVFEQLQKYFTFVYCPITQPNFYEFPLDWSRPETHHAPPFNLQRAIFIASRTEIHSPLLLSSLPVIQTYHG